MIQIDIYRDTPDKSHVLFWMHNTEKSHAGSLTKFSAFIRRLAAQGHNSRRPTTEYLGNKIKLYELRPTHEGNAYRILYFFYEDSAVLCDALLKTSEKEFDKAVKKSIRKRENYIKSPDKYSSKTWTPYLEFRQRYISQ